jgi:protein-S-isoprenylcysteine O-methyltransferase Ste14
MMHIVRALIPALWLLWLGYWIVAARGSAATLRRESLASRFSHYVPIILGGVFLGVPNSLGHSLEHPFHPRTLLWSSIAAALVAIGLGFSAWARAWLGRNWSAEVTVKEHHELVRSGPYALVRHPIYTGVLLALVGSALAVDRWRGVLGLLLIAAGFIRKLMIEEEFMLAEFGDGYRQYRAEVPALIPFVV